MTPEQAAESVLDQFKRAVAAELEVLTVECRDEGHGLEIDAQDCV